MRCSALTLLAVATTLFSGCTRNNDIPSKDDLDAQQKQAERITYYDTNDDGKVDYEKHQYVGWYDADWTLSDGDFDGRFEEKFGPGIGFPQSSVDLPVPTGVHIEPRPDSP
jgi:hypothetical protein